MKEVTFNEQNEIETHTEIRRPANRTSNFYKPSMERQLEEERVVTIILQEIIGNLYIYI